MTFPQFLSFTDIENDKVLFTWSANVPASEQLKMQQLLSSLSDFNIGDFYKVSRSNYGQLSEYSVIAQKYTNDYLLVMIE